MHLTDQHITQARFGFDEEPSQSPLHFRWRDVVFAFVPFVVTGVLLLGIVGVCVLAGHHAAPTGGGG
jgi:hypothetical protein